MILITERPSLNKIKMFFCNGDCNSFILNLKQNRSIPDNDINVYRVTDGTKFLCDSYNYIIENGTLTICKKMQVEVQKSKYMNWISMANDTINSLYSADEVDKINYLANRYTVDLIKSFYLGKVSFPSDYSVFEGVFVDIPPKAVPYIDFEYHEVPCQTIEVEEI